METQPVITIPKHTDKYLGFLNSAWVSPFEIDGKKWQSVDRYLLAKQFEGTVLEEKIRNAKNMFLAKRLANPKKILLEENDRLIRKYVYGEENCQMSDSWADSKNKHLKKATKAKFMQNKKLMEQLLKTKGIKIKGEGLIGEILEEIRNNGFSEKKKEIKRFISNPEKDIKFIAETPEKVEKTIKSFIKGVHWVREMENIKKVGNEIEMLEDVFYNFFDENDPETLKITNEVLGIVRDWMFYICESWENVIKNMPNFNELVRNIEEIIKTHKIADSFTVSIFLASIIRWIEMDATADEKERFYFRLGILKKKNFILPPLRRKYRRGAV